MRLVKLLKSFKSAFVLIIIAYVLLISTDSGIWAFAAEPSKGDGKWNSHNFIAHNQDSDVLNFKPATRVEDYHYPYVTGFLLTEGIYDRRLSGNNGYGDSPNSLFFNLINGYSIFFHRCFLMRTTIAISPWGRFVGDSKRIGFRELLAEYHEDHFYMGLGKFIPKFGLGLEDWRYFGIFGKNIMEQYRPGEMLGLYGAMKLPMVEIIVSFFHRDTTFIGKNIFMSSSSINYNLANTGNLWNWSTMAYFSIKDSIRLNLGYQDVGSVAHVNERSVVAAAEMLYDESETSLGFAPVGEAVFVCNYGGYDGRYVTFLTANLPISYEGWSAAITYSLKFDVEKSFDTMVGQIFSVGVNYVFDCGVGVGFSRKFDRDIVKFSAMNKQKVYLSSWSVKIFYEISF